MAHLIDMTNGRANMAYVGEKPWHGLGQELSQGASLDQWRVEAGLDWEARRNALYYRDATQTVRKCADTVLYRSDTGDELGIVSERYQIVQPAEVIEFFRDLTERQGFTMETAGSLDGGRKAWALARTGEGFRLFGQDEVKAYLLLATSFDGTLATKGNFVATRVVCNNTIQVALKEKGAISIPHSTTFDANKVKFDLGIMHDSFSQFEERALVCAKRRVVKKEALQYFIDLLEPGATVEDLTNPDALISTRKRNIIANVYELFAGRGMGAGLESANGTAWGLVNAVTQYVDHEQGNNVNNRFRSAQFGLGADLKTAAFELALKLAA